MNYQHYDGGSIFEILLKTIFQHNNISISLKPYEDFPALQNDGIDAIILLPPELNGKSIQVKMFKKTFDYGTFPWEVSRFLTDNQKHILEPHNADYHIIIDPTEYNTELNLIKLLIFKTDINIVSYYQKFWDDIITNGNLPPLNRSLNSSEQQYWVEEGQYEPSFKFIANKDIYQLKLQHTAYQRNVRCRWRSILKDRLELQYLVPKKSLKSIASVNELSVQGFSQLQDSISSDTIKLFEYLAK